MTERDANTVYVVDTPESEAEAEESVPPVYECTSDGVMHLWLIVPNRPSADGMVQLSEEQMRAALKFYDRSNLSSLRVGAPDAVTTAKKDKVVDPYDSTQDDDDDNAGYRHYYTDAREAGSGAVLLSCADGNEVDAVALAVLLLTRHHSRFDSDSDSRGYHDRRYRDAAAARGLGTRDVGSYTAYQASHASQVIDDDPRVSRVWKGLLEWPDVERVQAALGSCAY